MKSFFILVFNLLCLACFAQTDPKLQSRIDQQTKEIEPKLIEWRINFHEHPELSNRETKTGKLIAEYLKSLGMEVQYPVAKTGVVGILKSARPGPVVALRADMDGLPVNERNSLPFASKERSSFNGLETGVMHACGHDGHATIAAHVASVFAKNKAELAGTFKFVFQPAEEIVNGAKAMLEQKTTLMDDVDAVVG